MTPNENASTAQASPPESLIAKIFKMDRLLYLKIIQDKGSITSLEMTREILSLKHDLKPECIENKKVIRNNPNINARLRDLADLGILIDDGGVYSLSAIGFLLINELPKIVSSIEILKKHKWFFDTHDYTAILPQQFGEIYKLQFADQCKDATEYVRTIQENTGTIDERIRIITERLHDIPIWVIDELKKGRFSLELIYQFREPFKINSDDKDEQNLWKKLVEETIPKGEFRYLTFEDRGPIGIRIIDRKWAILNLLEKKENRMNRSRSFYGMHKQFVGWIEDIFSNIWDKSNPIDVKEIEIDVIERNP